MFRPSLSYSKEFKMAAVKVQVFLSCENCTQEDLLNVFKKMIQVAQFDAIDSVEDFGDENPDTIIAANLEWDVITSS